MPRFLRLSMPASKNLLSPSPRLAAAPTAAHDAWRSGAPRTRTVTSNIEWWSRSTCSAFFTTAAIAFASGAREIIVVSSVEQVFEASAHFPDADPEAEQLFAARLVCAATTARQLAHTGATITLVATGTYSGRDGEADEDFSPADLELCCQIDRFDFALRIERPGRWLAMRPSAG